ncbi:MAG: hypothetical protein QXR34_08470 [Saccharolobus sp.]
MQDSLGLLAITLVIIIAFSILLGILIFTNQVNQQYYFNAQNAINNEIIPKAKVGYYWIVEELKNNTISFIPHVYILDEKGVYNIKYVLETTVNGKSYLFKVNKLKIIFTNGSFTNDGIVLSPGEGIEIRPNITSGRISFITTTGNSFSLFLFPPSSKTLSPNESGENYTVIQIGNESILSVNTISHLLGPSNITSVELIYNSSSKLPLYNFTVSPHLTPSSNRETFYYSVKISYKENVTFIEIKDLKNNKTYIAYPGSGIWNGTVYAFYNNKLTPVGNFIISYNTTFEYYKYGPVNYPESYVINFSEKENGYVPLDMILYIYNVSNESSSGYIIIGKYSQLWVKPQGNTSPVKISYSGDDYSYFYYYNYSISFQEYNLTSAKIGGSTIYLGDFSLNIKVSICNYNIAEFNITYNNSQILTKLPIILNITYNLSYSPPFLLNFSFTNQSLPIMFNGTSNLPNYTYYIYKLSSSSFILLPINMSILNVNGNGSPEIVVYFVIYVNGKIIGENLPFKNV